MKKTRIAAGTPWVIMEITPQMVLQEGKEAGQEPLMGFLLHCKPLALCEGTLQSGANLLPEPYEKDATLPGRIDPLRWWRALQLLEAIPQIDEEILPLTLLPLDLFIAAGRHGSSSYFDAIIARVHGGLSPDQSYDEIMSRPVPLEVITLLMQLAEQGYNVRSAVLRASDEIAAGTLHWSQELERIGGKHPDWWQARRAAKALLAAQYASYLTSYAAFRGSDYQPSTNKKSTDMLAIEGGIYDGVERGIEQQYGEGITAMLAMAREEIATDELLETLEKQLRGEGAEQPRQPILRPDPLQRLQEITAWFVKEHDSPQESQPDETERKQRKYRESVKQLYERWERLPIVHLLVSEGTVPAAQGARGADEQRAIPCPLHETGEGGKHV